MYQLGATLLHALIGAAELSIGALGLKEREVFAAPLLLCGVSMVAAGLISGVAHRWKQAIAINVLSASIWLWLAFDSNSVFSLTGDRIVPGVAIVFHGALAAGLVVCRGKDAATTANPG